MTSANNQMPKTLTRPDLFRLFFGAQVLNRFLELRTDAKSWLCLRDDASHQTAL